MSSESLFLTWSSTTHMSLQEELTTNTQFILQNPSSNLLSYRRALLLFVDFKALTADVEHCASESRFLPIGVQTFFIPLEAHTAGVYAWMLP